MKSSLSPTFHQVLPFPERFIQHSQLLLDSYHHWTGRDLIPRQGDARQQAVQLFGAECVVVSHGTEDDPILNYGNQKALDLWEFRLGELLQTPSRYTAEPVHRAERARLLQQTSARGFVDDYRGVRVSRTGQRFWIEQATVWNLRDDCGNHLGQAATFSAWTPLPPSTHDSTLHT